MIKNKKQTAYLPVPENISEMSVSYQGKFITNVVEQEYYVLTTSQLYLLVTSVIKTTLETAAEKAECEEGAIVDLGFEKKSASVNKESIINLFKEVYQKLDLL
jgi:hypothetical protein